MSERPPDARATGGQRRPPPSHLTYGFTARHLRCDCCQRDYLPQHVSRFARTWWLCGNCTHGPPGPPRRYKVPPGHLSRPRCVLRHRYKRDPVMARALGFDREMAPA